MREVMALARADWLSAVSYRTGMIMSFGSLLLIMVPVYFVADALQPLMAEPISGEGRHYFAFLVLGLITAQYLVMAVTALPDAVQAGIRTGTLEALLSTRAAISRVLTGMIAYKFVWTVLRSAVMFVAALALGMSVAWGQSLTALAILLLIVLAHLPFGIIAAAMILAVRTQGPVPRAILVASTFLGGIYYPTHVIPTWVQHASAFLPLTYGLRALRQTLLEGVPLAAVLPDLGILLGFTVVLAATSALAFTRAFNYARRSGTLAQY